MSVLLAGAIVLLEPPSRVASLRCTDRTVQETDSEGTLHSVQIAEIGEMILYFAFLGST
jgi:hypothetical protein